MERRAPSATSALLQRASSQLKGERVKKPEDELNAYISSLTQKTSQQKKSVNFEDESISISSDLEDVQAVEKPAPVITSGSKFLKKIQPSTDSEPPLVPASNKFVKKPTPASVSPAPARSAQPSRQGTSNLSGSGQFSRPGSQASVGRLAQSSALDKATALTGKIQQKAATRRSTHLESDSDESLAAMMKMTKGVNSLSVSEQISESSESVKIGKDAGKFLKKASPSPTPAVKKSVEPPVTSVTQKDTRRASPAAKQNTQKKASPFTLKSSLKYSTDVVLTSEEESLAEFVGGLPSSSGDSFEKPHKKYSMDIVLTSEEESLAEFVGGLPSSSGDSFEKPHKKHAVRSSGRHTPSPPPPARAQSPTPYGKSGREPARGQSRSQSPKNKPPVIRRTPSPSPRASNQSPNLRRRSPSPKLIRSYSDDSNVADSIQSEIADDFDIGMNTEPESSPTLKKHVVIMDLDELGAPEIDDKLPPPDTPTHSSDRDSPFRSSVRKDKREDKKKDKSKGAKKGSKESAKESSPFKASTDQIDSPFKAKKDKDEKSSAKVKGSILKGSQSESPFKAGNKENQSPFKAGSKQTESPFKAGGKEQSPFKAGNKDNQSPFSAKTKGSDSPFLAKSGSSPFRASNEGSIFKSTGHSGSPFRSMSRSPSPDKDRSSPSFKAKTSSGKRNKKKQDSKKSTKKKGKTKKDKSSDLFSALGIQTVEDLLGGSSVRESEATVTVTEVDEDQSEVTEEIKTEKPSVYSYSHKFDNSVTEIVSEVVDGTKFSAAPSYTEEFDSISEKIGPSFDRGRSSGSDIPTRYSGEETVLDESDFTQSDDDSRTITRSRSRSRSDSRSRTRDKGERSYSDEESTYTEDYEDYSKSLVPTSRSDMTPLPKKGMASAEVQTPSDGMQYGWNPMGAGLAFPGMPYGLHFVDPTPIATHVVSADALEAMTAYSPAMLALQDMLKSQYDLTREFLETQKRLHDEFTRNIESTFHYTTLQDTKKFIKKNKKKKLTFKEALQLVDLEMAGNR